MSVAKIQHPSVDERRAEGKESRERTLSLNAWEVGAGR